MFLLSFTSGELNLVRRGGQHEGVCHIQTMAAMLSFFCGDCPEKHEATMHFVKGLVDLLTRYFLIFWTSFFDGFYRPQGTFYICVVDQTT